MHTAADRFDSRWTRALESKAVWVSAAVGVLLIAAASGPLQWLGGVALASSAALFLGHLIRARTDSASHRQHYADLRQLQRRLRRDGDPRTGQLVRRLRAVHKRMVRSRFFSRDGLPRWRQELHLQAMDLYRSCLTALERTAQLHEAAAQTATASIGQQLAQWREQILDEVQQGATHLEKAVDQVQATMLRDELQENDLAPLRRELEQGLIVAQNTQQRIDQLDQLGRATVGRERE